jgi:hypothetical protein
MREIKKKAVLAKRVIRRLDRQERVITLNSTRGRVIMTKRAEKKQ